MRGRLANARVRRAGRAWSAVDLIEAPVERCAPTPASLTHHRSPAPGDAPSWCSDPAPTATTHPTIRPPCIQIQAANSQGRRRRHRGRSQCTATAPGCAHARAVTPPTHTMICVNICKSRAPEHGHFALPILPLLFQRHTDRGRRTWGIGGRRTMQPCRIAGSIAIAQPGVRRWRSRQRLCRKWSSVRRSRAGHQLLDRNPLAMEGALRRV